VLSRVTDTPQHVGQILRTLGSQSILRSDALEIGQISLGSGEPDAFLRRLGANCFPLAPALDMNLGRMHNVRTRGGRHVHG
jgi:hypothetical protein